MNLARFFDDEHPIAETPISIAYKISAPVNKNISEKLYSFASNYKEGKLTGNRFNDELLKLRPKPKINPKIEKEKQKAREEKARMKEHQDEAINKMKERMRKTTKDNHKFEDDVKKEIPEWRKKANAEQAKRIFNAIGKTRLYSEEVKRIADALMEADDELISKVRKFMIQNIHPDKTKSNRYKEAFLKLTEVK